jgi:hypothetical protein
MPKNVFGSRIMRQSDEFEVVRARQSVAGIHCRLRL